LAGGARYLFWLLGFWGAGGGGGQVGAQDGVHAGLVTGAFGAEPGDDFGVEAEGRRCLGAGVTGISFLYHSSRGLPIGVGGDGDFQLGLGHAGEAFPVGAILAASVESAFSINGIALDDDLDRHGEPSGRR
jgi:hypothetical protein